VANHPSYTEMQAFEKTTAPTLVQCGDDDGLFPPEQVAQVEKDIFPSKKDAEIVVYSGVVHGWTIRGDLNNKEEKQQKEKATQAALEFLRKYL
jgi:dienelactone hydrolase